MQYVKLQGEGEIRFLVNVNDIILVSNDPELIDKKNNPDLNAIILLSDSNMLRCRETIDEVEAQIQALKGE